MKNCQTLWNCRQGVKDSNTITNRTAISSSFNGSAYETKADKRNWLPGGQECLLSGMNQSGHAPYIRQKASLTGLARALSKLGHCSRSQGSRMVRDGRVTVNGQEIRDPERRVNPARDRLAVDGQEVRREQKVYVMLNKPRGLVTSALDERGRDTVFACLADRTLPYVSPVGRLDKASEGLLLFTNDTYWAARITDPGTHLEKTYHVQVDCLADDPLARRIEAGVSEGGDLLAARRVRLLRRGEKNSWLEIVLDEGRNRHIRRLLGALGINVLRLIRVGIGPLALGPLAKGAGRRLTHDEIQTLRRAAGQPSAATTARHSTRPYPR